MTVSKKTFSSRCNPALFTTTTQNKVEAILLGKSDGDSIDNGRDLIFDPITEELIRRLFNESNFNSFTLNTDFSFKNKYFEVAYSPYYLLADLYIYNPVFPEISINLANMETLRITSGFDLIDTKYHYLTMGFSAYYYTFSFSNSNFSLLDLGTNDPEELIVFNDKSGGAADIGLFYDFQTSDLPRLAVLLKNAGTRLKDNDEFAVSATRQNAIFLFEPYGQISLGSSYKTEYGGVSFELMLPFRGYFETPELDYIALSTFYDLRLFAVTLGLSRYTQSLGMQFKSELFNIGISYANEDNTAGFLDQDEQSVYTSIEFNL